MHPNGLNFNLLAFFIIINTVAINRLVCKFVFVFAYFFGMSLALSVVTF